MKHKSQFHGRVPGSVICDLSSLPLLEVKHMTKLKYWKEVDFNCSWTRCARKGVIRGDWLPSAFDKAIMRFMLIQECP